MLKLVPVPSDDPPDEAENQLSVPALEVALSATVPLSQRAPGVVPVTVGMVLMVAGTLVRDEAHPFADASAKYVVVTVIDGVTKLVPVPSDEPPEAAANQLIAPALAVAASVTVPDPQREAGVDEATVGVVFTVATTAVRADEQPASVTPTK